MIGRNPTETVFEAATFMRKYLFYISHLYSFAIVRPLQKVITGRGDQVCWFFDDPTLKEHLTSEEKCLETIAEVKQFNPGVVFVPGNIVPTFFPGLKVELFHGFHVRKRSAERGHFRIRGFFDLYCTQGPDTTIPFRELEKEHGYFEVVETGWPKMDPFFADDDETPSTVKNIKPVIYLASTFTPRLSCARALFETVSKLVDEQEYNWLVNFHPKMDQEVIELYKSIQCEKLSYIETDNILPLMQQADLMVADTSSVISEFILLNKPVVTLNNRAPGDHLINITEPADLGEAIKKALSRPEQLMAAIKAYGDHIHPYRDGMSSQRVLAAADSLADRGTEHLGRKPLNLIRNFKIRKKMGYWFF